jgi:hypothetical protein
MISLVQDLHLGEPLETLEEGRSLQAGHLNAGRPSFRIGRVQYSVDKRENSVYY